VTSYVIIGRAADSTLVLDEPGVSSRHARLSWHRGQVLVEDLASANGVWAAGQRVRRVLVRPGDEVLLGSTPIPWARPELAPFLRLGAGGTVFLEPPARGVRRVARGVGRALGWIFLAGAVALALSMLVPSGREAVREVIEDLAGTAQWRPATSDDEAFVRARIAPGLVAAWDPQDPTTRNLAVRLAAQHQGTFRVEQVAAIWDHVHGRWRYVNDPRGNEYFARASESIANNFSGDCDDYAVTLASMVGAIGGRTRVVVMESPRGGHAYTEVCLEDPPVTVGQKLARYYHRSAAGTIHYRTSQDCPVWMTLDWNASVPGGAYETESWAVAVYADGHTETLAPAGAPHAADAGR
jgi:hypothetical protein